jgi:hypothetical protein
MESRWRRATEISSKVIGPHGIPVTPLINPRSGHSYHVINVIDDWKADYAVDVLIRDIDAYIVAFRRQLLVESKWYPGMWYRYTDVNDLPKETEDNAVDLGFKSSHGDRSVALLCVALANATNCVCFLVAYMMVTHVCMQR